MKKPQMRLDVSAPAAVPELVVEGALGVEVGEIGHAGPAGVGDHDVEAGVGGGGGGDEMRDSLARGGVGLDDGVFEGWG